MKTVYVILGFHAHELLWDLPDTLLSYLDDNNPIKDSILTKNYLKERREEGRDIYGLCSRFGDRLNIPLSVEYTNELLVQIKKVMPEV
ncbi:MAG: glycoside hydrolase, partial [Halanaerobiaceae bacterium]